MNIYHKLKSEIIESVSKTTRLGKEEIEGLLEKPPEGIKADFAFPCFVLAKKEKKNPVEIAKNIAEKIKKPEMVENIEVKGPYINFYFKWKSVGKIILDEILKEKERYGSEEKKRETVVMEYTQPNTHKAFHIGHVRNIVFGEALCRILEFSGHRIIRANYQGDVGPHVAKCLWGLMKLGLKEPQKENGKWLGEVYAKASKKISDNEKLEKEAYEINKKLYAGDKEIVKLWEKTRKWSLDYFEGIYKDFGVKYDRYYFESEVEKEGVKLAEQLLKKGIAKISEDAVVLDLKIHNLGVFVLITKEKTPLYSIKDMALAHLKNSEYKPDKLIIITGAEQNMYFQQLIKSLEIVNPDLAKKMKHISYELVNLEEGKMASRLGNVITYDELKDEMLKNAKKITKGKNKDLNEKSVEKISEMVTMGSIKYDMIKVSPEKIITFDWDAALSFEGNTAPYIQYTHARACSILEKAGLKTIEKFDTNFLKTEKEINILKKLIEFPSAIEAAARDYRPHYIANYVFELATVFNEFYQSVPVLKSEKGEREARLALVSAVKNVLKNGLNLLGIEAPEEM